MLIDISQDEAKIILYILDQNRKDLNKIVGEQRMFMVKSWDNQIAELARKLGAKEFGYRALVASLELDEEPDEDPLEEEVKCFCRCSH